MSSNNSNKYHSRPNGIYTIQPLCAQSHGSARRDEKGPCARAQTRRALIASELGLDWPPPTTRRVGHPSAQDDYKAALYAWVQQQEEIRTPEEYTAPAGGRPRGETYAPFGLEACSDEASWVVWCMLPIVLGDARDMAVDGQTSEVAPGGCGFADSGRVRRGGRFAQRRVPSH